MPNGYLYNLFIRLGFTTFAAQTAELVILKPAKILLIVLLAFIASRLAASSARSLASCGANRSERSHLKRLLNWVAYAP